MSPAEKVTILQHLVEIKSVNNHEKLVAMYLKTLFDEAGITNQVIPLVGQPERANLVAEMGSGHPILAVSGHMDVVDVDVANWTTDPFKLTPKGDQLFGRGTTDMKAGLAALVIAMLELKESQATFNGTIRLLATAGEEVGQPGAEALEMAGYSDDVDALLIAEPTGYYNMVYANKGELDIEIKSVGKAAHSSMPALGNNAIEHLLTVLAQIRTQIDQLTAGVTNPVLGETLLNVDTISGGNQINAIPSLATVGLNLRTIPEVSNDQILNVIDDVVANYNQTTTGQISVEVSMNIVSILGDVNAPLLTDLQRIAEPYARRQKISAAEAEQLKQAALAAGVKDYRPAEFLKVGISGGTDAAKLLIKNQTGFSYLAYGPGNNTPHQDNESVSKAMFLDFIEIYQTLFKSL